MDLTFSLVLTDDGEGLRAPPLDRPVYNFDPEVSAELRLRCVEWLAHVEPVHASHMIWELGDGGRRGGPFIESLVETIGVAAKERDGTHLALLAEVFPQYVFAFRIFNEIVGGETLLELRAVHRL